MPERRLSFLLISPLLSIALGVWVLASAITLTVGKPEQTKELLDNSGIYQAVIPEQVAEAQKNNPLLAGIPLDNPEIQKVLASSLDTQKIEAEGDKAVDAVYSWLEGKSDGPTINILVQADKPALAIAAGDYAAKYVSTLPACAIGEADYIAFSSNPLEATCLPPGASPDMVRGSVQQAISSNAALDTTTQLTEDDILLPNGKTVVESFNGVPVWYQRAQSLPIFSITVALVFVVLLVLILKLTRGIASAGKHFVFVGTTLAFLAILLTWATDWLYKTFIPTNDNPNIADALMRLTSLFNAELRNNIISMSVYLIAAGIAFLGCAYILRKERATPKRELQTATITSNDSKLAAPSSPAGVASPAPARHKKTAAKITHKKSIRTKKTTHPKPQK